MTNPDLVVVVAESDVRYTGDGEWCWDCPEAGCKTWAVDFSKTAVEAFVAKHRARAHP